MRKISPSMRGIDLGEAKMDKADRYRVRAQEMRKIADGLPDSKERTTLLDVAREYEELSLESAKGQGKRPNGAEQKPDRNSS